MLDECKEANILKEKERVKKMLEVFIPVSSSNEVDIKSIKEFMTSLINWSWTMLNIINENENATEADNLRKEQFGYLKWLSNQRQYLAQKDSSQGAKLAVARKIVFPVILMKPCIEVCKHSCLPSQSEWI